MRIGAMKMANFDLLLYGIEFGFVFIGCTEIDVDGFFFASSSSSTEWI